MGVRTNPVTGELRRPDEARRMRDILSLHQTMLSREELIAKRFVGIRLADGGSDGVVYDTRRDCVRHNANGLPFIAFQIPMGRLNEFVCDTLLWYWRHVWDNTSHDIAMQGLYVPNNIDQIEAIADATFLRHS